MNAATTEKCELLARSALFGNLERDAIEKLADYARVREVAAKEVVFHKGDSGDQMFALIEGTLRISTVSDEGKEVIFGFIEAGGTFGEISLLDGSERTATVTAVTKCRLLVIYRRDFIPFLRAEPDVAINLLEMLSRQLRMTDEMYEDSLFLSMEARLAKRLLALASQYGTETGRGVRIGLKLSQSELGNLVGTSRESVNKQMRAWELDGLVTIDQGYVVISDSDRVEEIANPV